ncbi:helix-turn-helix transcriptional regulator [Kitasatospora sp. NBC_00315]|uniref:helix-turn-helix transcriptional regulator n=1 Tax=Kitasatospora sp. NBC_00315 TaxID=2975963 RepID=UPI003255D374
MDDLGSFLKSRRARLRPEDAGLIRYGERRRVPGLRREELAQLAGVSASYYARLEQGLGQNVSQTVLDALSRALRLDGPERAHLATLARPARPTDRPGAGNQLPLGLRRLVDMVSDVPMMVLSPSADVLAWNPLAHSLFAGHRSELPNMTRLIFLDPQMRLLFVDWRAKAESVVAHLRLVSARYPENRRIAALVTELSVESADFVDLWGDHSVADCDSFTNDLMHPLVGPLSVRQEVLRADSGADQLLVAFTVEPHSPSERALRQLADLLSGVAAHAFPTG